MKTKRLKLGFIGGALDSAIGTTHKIASLFNLKIKNNLFKNCGQLYTLQTHYFELVLTM